MNNTQPHPLNLNIGAGLTHIPGFINIDSSERADLSIDLECEKLPFADSSVDVVFTYHTLEHISNYLFALGEIHRVLKHGGKLFVGVPYATLTKYHLINPYHLQNFNEYSFDFFDPNKLQGSAAESSAIHFEEIFSRIHYIGVFKHLPAVMKRWCRDHMLNVAQKIDFGLVAMKFSGDQHKKPHAIEMLNQFDTILASRIPYK